jgi:hydrogenase nickel incorporation protein HypA/HybF
MHELSLAQAIWREVRRQMRSYPGGRLAALHVVVGALSGADPESLDFALGLVAADSDWPEATMDVRPEPVGLECRACGRRFDAPGLDLTCPGCGGLDVEVTRGRDLRIESLEIETRDGQDHEDQEDQPRRAHSGGE